MALIKCSKTHDLTHDAIVLDLGDLKQQALRLRVRAQQEADQILTAARYRGEQLSDESQMAAREKGLAEGRAEGLAEGRRDGHAEALAQSTQRLEVIQQRWIDAVGDWEQRRVNVERDAQNHLLELTCQLAEKVVRRVVTVDPAIVQEQVREAIGHVVGPVRVSVRIHPDDRELVAEAMPALERELDGASEIDLIEDSSIEAGGCCVDHGEGRIDATLATQLDRLVSALIPDRQGGGA